MASNKINTIVLYLSSLLNVLVGVGISVLNTGSLSTAEYGNVRYINNIMSFFSSIFLFGFFVSGARLLAVTSDCKLRKKINGAMVLILVFAIFITILGMVLCYFIHINRLNSTIAPLFLYSIPVCYAPLLLNYVNNTFQGENRILNLSIARSLPGLLYLVIAYVVYKMVEASALLMILLQNGLILVVLLVNIIYTKPSFSGLRRIFRLLIDENKRYGLHVYVGSLFAVSFGYLAGISLGIFGEDNTQVGFYMLASTITAPLAILPAIMGTSYFKQFATQSRINSNLLVCIGCISVVSLLIFIVIIYPVVIFLYDYSYMTVGRIAMFLAVATTIHGLGDLINRFLGAHGRGKELRNGAIACGVILFVGNIVFVYFWGIEGAIATRILSSSAYMIAMIWYYKKFINISF